MVNVLEGMRLMLGNMGIYYIISTKRGGCTVRWQQIFAFNLPPAFYASVYLSRRQHYKSQMGERYWFQIKGQLHKEGWGIQWHDEIEVPIGSDTANISLPVKREIRIEDFNFF